MSGRPRLSLNLMATAPVGALVELAREAERLGFARCWVYDEGLHTRDVHVVTAAIAVATRSLGVGPGITNPYTRHPGVTAAAVATLDELSGGRAFLGLGAGGGLTLAPLGLERDRPLTAVREMVESTRRLLAGESVDLDGTAARFRGARLGFGRPDIPIVLAGRGPRMMALAADVADGFYLSYLHKDLLAGAVATLRSGSRGRLAVTWSTMAVTDDEEMAEARAQLSFRLVDSPPEVKERIGLGPDAVAAIRSALAEGGPPAAARHVREDWVAHFALVGTEAECGAELADLMARHDLDEFLLPVQSPERAAPLLARTAALLP